MDGIDKREPILTTELHGHFRLRSVTYLGLDEG